MTDVVDAVVIGAGPNGLAAAVTIARAGLAVRVLEEQPTVGGGSRTLDLGLAEGVVHDLCAAVHPMAWASPFFAAFDLPARGVEFGVPEVSFAQPLDGGRAGIAYRSLDRTAERIGGHDGAAWASLLGPLVQGWRDVVGLALGDHRSVPAGLLSRGTGTAARFGAALVEQGTGAWDRRFHDDEAAALLTGVGAHATTRLPSFAASGTALLLATLAHADGGWPIPRGGSAAITAALVADLLAHGGRIDTGHPVRTVADLPEARAYVFDTTPRTVAEVLASRLSPRVAAALTSFRYGNGAAKVDFVLSGPVPWSDPEVGKAGTVHVGGTRAEMVAAEAAVAAGRHPARPVALVSDPTVVDPSRRVGELRPLWSYAHVPAGSPRDVTEDVTAQIERFAPGFRDLVVAARCIPAAQMSRHNANYVGGDIASGAMSLRQTLARPTSRWDPYDVGLEGVYLCSASTPPGPGVHGLGGWYAARRVLRREFDVRTEPSLSPLPSLLA